MRIEKMSVKQRRILAYIHLNAEATYEQIAKNCGTKTYSARYEVTNLIKSKLIAPCLILNYAVLGIEKYHVYFKLQSNTEKDRETLISYLCQHARVSWVGSMIGEYDFAIAIMAFNVEDLSSILDGILADTGNLIGRRYLAYNRDWYYYGKKYIFSQYVQERPIEVLKSQKKVKVDKTDIEILKVIALDYSASLSQLSAKTKLPISTLSHRIAGLKKKGVIDRYLYRMSNAKLRMGSYRVLLDFAGVDEALKGIIQDLCASHTHIVSLQYTLGPWDIEIGLDAENHELAQATVSQFLSRIPKPVIKKTILARSDLKWVITVPGILEDYCIHNGISE